MNNRRTTYVFLGLGYFLLLLAVIFVRNTQVNGYEDSIYSNIPEYAWVLLTASYALSAYVLISSARSGSEKSFAFGLGLLLLFLVSVFVLAIPVMKYDAMYGVEDNWYHLGYSRDIMSNGHVDLNTNYYPQLHILMVEISEVSSIDLQTLYKMIWPFLFSLNVLFMYLLAWSTLKNRLSAVIAASFSATSTYVIGIVASPWNLSIPFMFLILFLILRESERLKCSLMLFIALLALAITHALTGLVVASGLAGFALIQRLLKSHLKKGSIRKLPFSLSLAFLAFIITLAWAFMATTFYANDVRIFGEAIVSASKGPLYLLQPHPTLSNLQLFVRFWSSKLIQAALAMFALAIVLKSTLLRKGGKDIMLLVLAGWFVVCLAGFLVTEHTVTGVFLGSTRFLQYAFFLLPIYAGFCLYMILDRYRRIPVIPTLSVLILLALSFVSGLFVVYPSPYIQSVNLQTTDHQIQTITWLVQNTNQSFQVWSDNHYASIAAGLSGFNDTKNKFVRGRTREMLLLYLGYRDSTSLTSSESSYLSQLSHSLNPIYVIIDTYMTFYFKGEIQISSDKLYGQNNRPMSNLVYDNGECWIYTVNATISP